VCHFVSHWDKYAARLRHYSAAYLPVSLALCEKGNSNKMVLTKSFKKAFVAGSFWGASVVASIAAIFYISAYFKSEGSGLLVFAFSLLAIVLLVLSNVAGKRL